MTFYLKKDTFIKLISFTAAVVVCVVVLFVKVNQKTEKYSLELNNIYSQNLADLNYNISGVVKSLKKIVYSNSSEQFSSLSADILNKSQKAEVSLSGLPNCCGEQLTVINKYLSQVGDYTDYLSGEIILDGKLEAEQRTNLKKLLKIGEIIENSIAENGASYQTKDCWQKELNAKINKTVKKDGFLYNLKTAESDLAFYPTLVYNGKFSDKTVLTPKFTQNSKLLTKQQAKRKVAKQLGLNLNELKSGSDTFGTVECYGFYTKNTSVSVTKRGGEILFFRKYRKISKTNLTAEKAIAKAKSFLIANTNEDFYTVSHFTEEGVCTVTFAYRKAPTVFYPDQIKVGVALDNGETVFLQAEDYILNHKTRTEQKARYTIAQAEKVLSKEFTVTESKPTVILSDGGTEIPCYEFKCTADNKRKYIVYINRNTLSEEKLLTVTETYGGVVIE